MCGVVLACAMFMCLCGLCVIYCAVYGLYLLCVCACVLKKMCLSVCVVDSVMLYGMFLCGCVCGLGVCVACAVA